MLSFLWWLIIGLIAGFVARLLIPGKQPMSWVLTMLLGLAGSIIGGLLSAAIFGYNPADPGFHTGGLIMSIVGATILLGLYVAFAQRQTS